MSALAQNLAQLVSLLWCVALHSCLGALGTLVSLLRPSMWLGESHDGVVFYVGRVFHSRKHPAKNAFAYPLRFAIVDLDAPPPWFLASGQAVRTTTPMHAPRPPPTRVKLIHRRCTKIDVLPEKRNQTKSDARRASLAVWGLRPVRRPKNRRRRQSTSSRPHDEADHLTADEARARCGTDGPVRLFTSPWSFGYVQNPISVYYCYAGGSSSGDVNGRSSVSAESLVACIAEVTNTPWGERVTFNFDPAGQRVPKALHVSPFMDMRGDWHISATHAGEKMSLTVNVVNHPVFGDYFHASLRAKRDDGVYARGRNERSGLRRLMAHGCTPHRVAFWIYQQALVVLWKGVSFFPPPGLALVSEAGRKRGEELEKTGRGCPLRSTWRPARAWPWVT